MGTCVTYMVVLGDLGPQIVSKILNIDNTTVLRCVNNNNVNNVDSYILNRSFSLLFLEHGL